MDEFRSHSTIPFEPVFKCDSIKYEKIEAVYRGDYGGQYSRGRGHTY